MEGPLFCVFGGSAPRHRNTFPSCLTHSMPTVKDTGVHQYRALFQGADPVWNVTGGGGTNRRCLAANVGEEWKCLMAPYIAPHVETPIFVMNAA